MTVTFPGESPEYRKARNDLLDKEIELRREMEAVSAQRRALPPGGRVAEDYVFDGLGRDGKPAKIMLSELFAPGKDSLIVYDFMFPRHLQDKRPGPTEGETARLKLNEGPCPSCVNFLDMLDPTTPPLEAAGFNFVVIAKAPLDRVLTFARERGWKHLRLLSAANNTYKRDYHSEKDGSSMPMLHVFQRDGDGIRHFWSSEMLYAPSDPGQDPRHNGTLDTMWNMMDFTPEGRPDFHEQMRYDNAEGTLAAVAESRRAKADARRYALDSAGASQLLAAARHA